MNTFTKYSTTARPGLIMALAALCLALTGCSFISRTTGGMVGPVYHPDNVYRFSPMLTDDLHRVALLPIACDEKRSDLVNGRESLESVLYTELVKTKKFEIVRALPQDMERLTGRERWTGTETLSTNFLTSLKDYYGCDAVLFAELTALHPYSPLVIGWRLKLVDVRNNEILWAGDEVVDGGQPAVQAGIRRYQSQEGHNPELSGQEWVFLNSPEHFGQYAAAQLFETLPAR